MLPNNKSAKTIRAKGLSVTYVGAGRIVPAVSGLNFEIKEGELACFLGTTGCGKSTILNVIGGFIQPTKGDIFVGADPIRGPSSERGCVFQQSSLFSWKTVRGNVEFGLKMKGMNRGKRGEIADQYIRLVGLAGFEKNYPNELSGGMQQRVELARALANEPSIILMDEPFGSLDAQTRSMMQELLLSIWQRFGKTIVFVTHDVDEAIFLADRIFVLTARPATLKQEVAVSLPRPRTYEITTSEKYIEIKRRVLTLIREETLKVLGAPETATRDN